MKKSFIAAVFVFALSLLSLAQGEKKTPMDGVLKERQVFYKVYADAKMGIDTTKENMIVLANKMEQVIKLDDIIIDQYLFKEFDRANELQTKVDDLEKDKTSLQAKHAKSELYFMIAAGGAALFFLLFVVMLILVITKGGKAKKISKQIAEKDELLTSQETKVKEVEKNLGDQNAQLKKDYDGLKTSTDQERRAFKLKEDEFIKQVAFIEEKIKKASQKESDLNYQVFQLELKLKNELEGTIQEKCKLENQVIDLKRELSEVRLKLEEESKKPKGDENAFNELRGKISWFETEVQNLRQWAENEKQAKENAENILRDKNNETEGLYRERDELWGRINGMEGHINELGNQINDLNGQVGNLHNEKNQLEEQLRNNAGQGDQLNDLHNRIRDLEDQINGINDEKNGLYNQINELRPRAEEADHLRNRLNELLGFVDRLRSGN
jgi:DNA repair exonuclease SbcCD ATPase subunit